MANKRVEALIERSTKHGQAGRETRSRTYLIWQSMVGRCYRPSDGSYKYYGAKGITVCDRWRKFENFFEDMGTAPDGTHIHRLNDATIYSKETCRWLSEKEHIGLHNQQHGWGARLNKSELIDRVVGLQKELAAAKLNTIAEDRALTHDTILDLQDKLADERENLMKLERDWHKVINEVLKCNPIPARDRPDGQLEPPWEVIARLREQLATERQRREQLVIELQRISEFRHTMPEIIDIASAAIKADDALAVKDGNV